jgi:hypothetical protein
MPIRSWPIDQGQFTRITLVSSEPKLAYDNGATTNIQQTSKDGTQHKWTVEAVFGQPSPFQEGRTDSELMAVTITTPVNAPDPAADLVGEIRFVGLTAGAAPPESTDSGRIRGGKIFLQATGVRPAKH